MRFIKKWLEKQREKNKPPLDTPYTLRYTLGELPLPQPWRKSGIEGIYFLPTSFVTVFTDRERMSLLRVSEPQQLDDLEADMLTKGITTPLELWMDQSGKLRLQEGHHRMVVVLRNLESFPRVPVVFRVSNGRIKSYGRSVVEEFPSILDILGKNNA